MDSCNALHRKSWGNPWEIYLIHTFTSKSLAIMLAKNHRLFTSLFVMTTKGLVMNIRELYCIKRYRTSFIDSIKGKCHHTYHTPFSKKKMFTTKPMRGLQIFPQFGDQKQGTNKETPGFIELCCSKSLGRWATAGLDREFLLTRSLESWIVANKQQPSGWAVLSSLDSWLSKQINQINETKNIRPSSNIGKWRFRSAPCTKLTN